MCKQAVGNGISALPTLVLKITMLDGGFTVQLHESKGERAQYIALSHCWGKSGPLRTLKSNVEHHKRGIPRDDMPLSFQDVIVKVWYLGFKYLWIDSLCIVQDDSADWEAEAARMAEVYSNATITFAATEAADPSEGCQPSYTQAFPIPLEGDDVALVRFQDNNKLDSRNAPLNKRGWTFQEAALSRRMVCFDDNQMLWKCTSRHESEDGLLVSDNTDANMGDWNIWACLPRLAAGEQSYGFWYSMMEDYSSRELTFEKDKLPALAGIVGAFKKGVDDTPLLGLWLGDLLRGLLWRAEKPTERVRRPGVVPSWSWTSVAGRVSWTDRKPASRLPDEQLEIISGEVSWVGPPMTSSVSAAALKVCGRMREARAVWTHGTNVYLHEIDESPIQVPEPHMVERLQEDIPAAPEILGFCYMDLPETRNSRVWCLEVYRSVQEQGSDTPRNHAHQVVVLAAVDEEQDQFRRLGVGCVWRRSYRKDGSTGNAVKETFREVPRRTITII